MSRARTIANYGNGITADEIDVGQLGGRRNLIINGAMVVNQRNQTVTTSDAFYVDRFKAFYNTSSGTYSIAQDSDAPDNFEYSSKVTITASDDLTGSEFMTLAYYAEGYDVAPLNFGTAAAREFTLSFWVKSSVAGTYGVSFRNHAANRSFVSSYTINSANTWEHKSVTVTADANGSWVKTNGIGLVINWELGNSANYSTSAGSWQSGNYWGLTGGTKLVNTNGATLQLTGVQLEVGTVATPFEHRSYGEELALCQRYFCKIENTTNGGRYFGILQAYASDSVFGILADYPQVMRTTPSVGQGGTFGFYRAGSENANANTSVTNLASTSRSWQTGGWGGSSVLTAGHAAVTFWEVGAYLTADAEL